MAVEGVKVNMETLIFILVGIVLIFILFKMVKAFFKWTLFLLIAVAILGYFTNPSESTHRQSLKEKLQTERLKRVRNKFVSVKDYKIFSLTTVEVEGKEYHVG